MILNSLKAFSPVLKMSLAGLPDGSIRKQDYSEKLLTGILSTGHLNGRGTMKAA